MRYEPLADKTGWSAGAAGAPNQSAGRNLPDAGRPHGVVRCEGGKAMTPYAAFSISTPFCLSVSWSSPDWDISRMMSQPPRNSPLT